MAREIKKPAQVREKDLKEYAGDVVIDVSPKSEASKKEEVSKEVISKDAAAEQKEVKAAEKAPSSKLISFHAWFQKVSARNPKIKLSYKEAIEAHCRAVGLDSQSTEEAYDAALKHFGL